MTLGSTSAAREGRATLCANSLAMMYAEGIVLFLPYIVHGRVISLLSALAPSDETRNNPE